MKEISVLGITMTDYSLREALRLAESYMDGNVLNTICHLNTDLLMKAKDDQELKAAVAGMDMLVPGAVGILEAGGILSMSRRREVEGNFFIREFLKRLARERRKIFLLANTQEELVAMRALLLSMEKKLTFFGSFTYDGPEVSQFAVVNEINSVVPDVIISMVPSPGQEKLMYECRQMVNARVWISFQEGMLKEKEGKGGKTFSLTEFIDRFIFKRTVKKYDDK